MLQRLLCLVLLSAPVQGFADKRATADVKPQHSSALTQLTQARVVDLSHKLDTGIPHWAGFRPATRTVLYDYPTDGFLAEEYCHVGQWGTHVDPPGHFFPQGRRLDDIEPKEMILPLAVIDVHEQAAADPDYSVTVDDIRRWEKKHGPIPPGGFVALRTDWSQRWPDQEKMLNRDANGVMHYPGWSLDALRYLYEIRGITASGHETTDTGPGTAVSAKDYSHESYILGKDRYQIELLANLDQVPESGAIAIVTWPNVARGSGFPARVLALVPNPSGEPR